MRAGHGWAVAGDVCASSREPARYGVRWLATALASTAVHRAFAERRPSLRNLVERDESRSQDCRTFCAIHKLLLAPRGLRAHTCRCCFDRPFSGRQAMERGAWSGLATVVQRALPVASDRRFTFAWDVILLTYLWAVIHNQPISWACRPDSWPEALRPPRLPTPSTMSRRLRRPLTEEILRRAICRPGLCFGSPLRGSLCQFVAHRGCSSPAAAAAPPLGFPPARE